MSMNSWDVGTGCMSFQDVLVLPVAILCVFSEYGVLCPRRSPCLEAQPPASLDR